MTGRGAKEKKKTNKNFIKKIKENDTERKSEDIIKYEGNVKLGGKEDVVGVGIRKTDSFFTMKRAREM